VRAYHEAETARGPAVVIVPMDDWPAPAGAPHELFGPRRVLRSAGADPRAVDALAELLDEADAPALVAGAGADWTALVALAERLGCPVWQEPFGGFAGFPQDHPQFAGHLPARRARVRATLAPHDVVLVVGTGALRQYPFDPGPARAGGHAHRRPHAGPRRGPPQPGRAGRARRPRGDVRGAGAGGRAARAERDADAAPRAARSRRAAARGPCAAGARRPAPARRDPRRGDALEPPRAARPRPRHRAARLRQRDGPARLRHAGRDRAADGAPRPPGRGRARRRRVALPDPLAVDGREVRGRRAVRRARQRRLRDHGPAGRAQRRARPLAGRRRRHPRARPCPGLRGDRRLRSRRAAAAARRALPRLADRREPLLLAVEVAQDATFDP